MTGSDFGAVMAPLARPGGPGAAVAVRRRGEVIHAAGYGLANVEWGIPIDTDTVFRIGSITKQFTAAAILRLAEEGRLAIDDPMERHLPDYPTGGRAVTVRHLLSHTSGIKSYTELPNFFAELSRNDRSLAQLIDIFKDLPPDFQPGERYLYNNSGYVLLGAIIEAVSGRTYEDYLRETFFGPLGMARTYYLHDEPIVKKRASGYGLAAGRGLVNAPPLSMSLPHAAGSLGSTVHDLLTWDAALHGGRVVSAESYAAMIAPGRLNDGSATKYGFGLGRGAHRERATIGHGGGINGFLSYLGRFPDDDLTVAVLSNSGAFAVDQAAFGLARRALGLPDLTHTPVSLGEAELAAMAGAYQFEIGPLQLRVQDGALGSHFPRPRSLYQPIAEDAAFLADDPEVVLQFEDLRDGAYQRLVFRGYGDPATGARTAPPA